MVLMQHLPQLLHTSFKQHLLASKSFREIQGNKEGVQKTKTIEIPFRSSKDLRNIEFFWII